MANSGHFNVEINREDLDHLAVKQQNVKPDIEEFVMNDGRKVYLLAEGRLVNLAGERGQGHPAEIMDLSFAMQALSAKQLVETQMEIGVHKTPDEADMHVARLKLEAMGIEIDNLTERQENTWKDGKKARKGN